MVEVSVGTGESLKLNGSVPDVAADKGSPDIVDKVKQEGEPLSDGDLQSSVALPHDDGLLYTVSREGPAEFIFANAENYRVSRREKETD